MKDGRKLIWVTGCRGMLGSAVMKAVGERDDKPRIVSAVGTDDIRIHDPSDVAEFLDVHPEIDIVINCAGRVPLPGATSVDTILSNAVGPHMLASSELPVVHMSTDCVFDGSRAPDGLQEVEGNNLDPMWRPIRCGAAPADAHDTYGRTKALGEVDAPNVVNVRGSFVGWDGGLLKWLLEQRGPIDAWEAAHWSGTSVHLMADLLVRTALRFLDGEIAAGTYHAATERHVSKADLLRAIAGALELPVTLRSVQSPAVWRVLAPSPGFVLPPVAVAVADLVERYRARVQA